MKRRLTLLSAILVLTTASITSAKAQVHVSLNIGANIGAQPMWAPVGYESTDYYYLPDIECYYYVPRHQFVYMNGPNWVFSSSLPDRCRGYDLYSGYKVVCKGPRPYANFYHDRVAYAQYRGWRGRQQVWRDYRGGGYGGGYAPGPRGGYYGDGPRGHAWGHYEDRGRGGWDRGDYDHHDHGRGHWRD